MTATITPSVAVAQAVVDAAEEPEFWTGRSGEPAPGELVARHLEAVLALLEKRGWTPVRRSDETTAGLPDPDDDALSVKAMVRGLLRAVRDNFTDSGPVTFAGAWYRVDGGDNDARTVADRLLDEMVRARTGHRSAFADAWISKNGRTFDEVRDLLSTAAAFAREHGPRG